MWTDKQQKAIDTRNKNLLISAAAGSGKTAVLVERILKILEEERISIESMLIVTFTNAAAGEMKERIQKKLQGRISELGNKKEADITTEEKELIGFLKEQIKNIPRASISTVHSFCIDTLRNNFQFIDIDPSFKIANESLVIILQEKAIETVFDIMYESKDAGFLSLVDNYGGEKSDKALVDIVYQLYRFVQSQPYPSKWLEKMAQMYTINTKDNLESDKIEAFKKTIWYKNIKDISKLRIQSILNSCDKAINLCHEYDPPLAYLENILDDKLQIQSLENELEKNLQEYVDHVRNFKMTRLKTINTKTIESKGYDNKIITKIKDIRKTVVKSEAEKLGDFFGKGTLIQAIDDIGELKKHAEAITKLVNEFDFEYGKLKQENGVLDFSDLEHFTIKVLENESVKKNLQDKYKHIFFDEYQDSNLVQETIINSIKRENNLFFVGDVKQSIYRFRLSDPTLFNNRYKNYSNEEDYESEKIDLSQNFRSREEILDFCNYIFEGIMSEETGEIDYKDKSHHLIKGKEFEPYKDNIKLAIIDKMSVTETSDKNSDSEEMGGFEMEVEEEESVSEDDELEALYVAMEISKLVNSGNANYNEIAVLMRSPKSKAKIFEKIFALYSIPCYVDFKSSSYEKIEIRCLLDYLRVIDNKNQDEPLIGAMLSVFGNFEIADIIKIRIAYEGTPFCISAQLYAEQKNDKIALQLQKFYEQIEKYKRLEKMWPLSDFIWHIVEETNYSTYTSGLVDGKNRIQNILNFVGKSSEYEESETMGLYGFLGHVDKILKSKGDSLDKSSLIETENAVTIMSVHKSKGLEFKCVFLCDLGKRINEQDLKQDIVLHNQLGIGLKYKNIDKNIQSESIPRRLIRAKKENENLSEEIRILYVALTRAIDRLYLVGTVKDAEKFAKKVTSGEIDLNVRKQKNYLSWICSVLAREKNGEAIRNKGNESIIEEEVKSSKIKYSVEFYTPQRLGKISRNEKIDREEMYNSLINRKIESEKIQSIVSKICEFEYPFIEDTRNPNKRSVTEIAKSYVTEETIYQDSDIKLNMLPNFMTGEKKFTKAEIGSVTHLVIEQISLEKHDVKSVNLELDRMIKKEMITEEEREVVDIEGIVSFFKSELGKRLLKSEEIYREKEFLMRENDTLIDGIIDCYFIENGGIVLVDYKTDEKVDEKKYEAQLLIYKTALENIYKMPVIQSNIYWLKHRKCSTLKI